MIVRWIEKDEISWINQQYEKIDFLPPIWEKDRVAVALIENEKVGIGRLVPLADGSFELGGIYVLESFRGRGIARKIVSFLINNAAKSRIYCLPYEHLREFYQTFGLVICDELPKEVQEKYLWCLQNYSQHVLAMEKPI